MINPEVAALFRRTTPTLSLAVHGNDHVKQELGRCTSEDASRRLLAQALHRITRFEQRSGLSVARVMIAPHGICSRPAMRALADCGFDAACFWMGPDDAADPTLAGWEPADATEEGLPVISRHPLTGSSDDLVFQAYLRKPLILYGHHQDLEGGLERLSEAAMSLSRLGDVRWCPLGEIAATNAAQGLSGAVLRLRLFSRLVAIRVPDGVEKVVVEPTALTGGDTVILSDKEGREAARGAPGTQLSVGAREVEIRL